MTELVALLVLALCASVAGLAFRDRITRRLWMRAGRRLELAFVAGELFEDGDILEGQIESYPIVFDNLKRQGTSVVLHAEKTIPPGCAVWRQSALVNAPGPAPHRASPFPLGDTGFDGEIAVVGEPSELLSRLDRASRCALRDAVCELSVRPVIATVEVKDGAVIYSTNTLIRQSDRLKRVATSLVAVAGAFDCQGTTFGRLASLCLSADEPREFQIKCFEALREKSPGSPEALEVAKIWLALSDGDKALRAAMLLGSEEEALVRAESIFKDSAEDPSLRTRALRHLVPLREPDSARRLLFMAVDDGATVLRITAARLLWRSDRPAARERVLALAEDPEREVLEEVAGLIGQAEALGDGEVEGTLVRMLRNEGASVQSAAVKGLGECGSTEAVAALQAIAKSGSSGKLRMEAKAAIRRIQTRAAGAGAGHLSLAAGAAKGELSMHDGGGAVSPVPSGEVLSRRGAKEASTED